jgi:hypothetical protein
VRLGIDVQAELRAKTGSPSLGPTHMPHAMAQPPTVQRAIMNRHHQARRSNSNIAPKIEPGTIGVAHSVAHSNPSPQSRPTPTSHHSSPTSHSPGFPAQGVMTPPASDSQIQQQRLGHPLKPMPQGMPAGGPGVHPQAMAPVMKGPGGVNAGMGGPQTAYYPSPFQNHIEQLGKFKILSVPLFINLPHWY